MRDDADASPAGASRREFLCRSLAVGAGALLPGTAFGRGAAGAAPRARAVVQVFLQGGLSHLDTFDPKPDAPVDVRGAFRSIRTAIDGEQFTELCPRLAKLADRLVVIRSLTHTEAAHERAQHNMLTGYRPSPAIVYPSFGSVVSHELGMRNDLPPYVCIPRASVTDLGTGYLGSAFGPFDIGSDPARRGFEVKDLAPSSDLDPARAQRRRQLLAQLDSGFVNDADAVDATEAFYEQAWKLIDSPAAREAFRLDAEPDAVRDRYGRTGIGQSLLLARRLVEAGVRFVAVPSGGWDHHRGIVRALRRQMPPVDQAFAALVEDLDERGLLDSTMTLLSTEFGRTPRANRDDGRDHWPRAFACVAAGGGWKRGVVHGRTDPTGSEPESHPVSPADVAATMFAQLGIDPEKRLMSPGDRPIDIVRGGSVLRGLLA